MILSFAKRVSAGGDAWREIRLTVLSVRERCDGTGSEAHNQGERNYEVCLCLNPMRRICALTQLREDDSKWPQKNKDGRQELEIRIGNEHISFEVWF